MENLINQLKELKENYEMGFYTDQEYYNMSIDAIVMQTANVENEFFIFKSLIDKIIS